ncbi:unnamed protein product [Dicrocoelium dendriticum]|nr:unnamed protein product [Dicrocoelium dendriticum]
MQYRSHPPLDLLQQQPLTRRHSDWVVNSTNPLLDPFSSRLDGLVSQQITSPLSFDLVGVTTETQETNSSPFTSSGGFDFLKAFIPTAGTSTNAAPQYPPGFESIQHQQLSSVSVNPLFPPLKTDDLGSGGDTACITSLNGPWSNNGCTSTSIFMPSHGSLAQHDFTAGSDSLPKTSLLQHLFSSPQSGSLLGDIDAKTATQLNAIWSPSATGDLPSSDDHLYAFPSYIEAAASALVDIHDDPPSSKRDLSLNSSSDTFRASSSPIDSSARCGAIGEGRRRRRGVSSPSLPNDHTSLGPITSVPSTVASITEVA